MIAQVSPSQPRGFMAILVGGFMVGVLDLAYAIIVYSPHAPIRIPQTIASGLLGSNRAYQGGVPTAVLGVVLHFVIAFGAAAMYYFASRAWPVLTRRAIVCGLIYGALVYGFMHVVVLPHSAAAPHHMPLVLKAWEFVEHCFFVGLPISLSTRYFLALSSKPNVAALPTSRDLGVQGTLNQ